MASYTIDILDIIEAICESQMEKGVPYILFKDTINKYSMQKNIGIIKSSNLCAEIQLHSSDTEYATCNLSSICLSKFVEDSYSQEELNGNQEELNGNQEELNGNQAQKRVLNHEFPQNPRFNFKQLVKAAAQVAENINNVIDRTWNPVIETARSNFKHRPLGIGLQGLNDVFMKFRFPFESVQAQDLNKKIAEAIYYGALSKSTELARSYYQKVREMFDANDVKEVKIQLYPKELLKQFPALKKENTVQIFNTKEEIPRDVGAYSSYNKLNEKGEEAPIKTKFHWELYGLKKEDLSGMFDWDTLRNHINIYGVRNSTMTALMPTASTSQIMGNTSCFEPSITNLYKRKTLAGYFTIINKYLMNDLMKAGLWNTQIKQYLLENEGSIQNLEGVPQYIKDLYKTAWDITQKTLIDLAAARQPFIDQSQSLNLFLKKYDASICASVMLYGWKTKNKTGSYYIRVPPSVEAQKFTVNINKADLLVAFDAEEIKNELNQEEEYCLLCSS
jgi:ribonucleotide reductase alpha subunit